jgi:hypothetical protein
VSQQVEWIERNKCDCTSYLKSPMTCVDFIFCTGCSENSEKSRCSTPDAVNTSYIDIIFSIFHAISHQLAEKNE